jgi:hypothetical protein
MEIIEEKEDRKRFSGNIIFFLQFNERVQRGKNALNIHKVGIALDAADPMVFAEIPSKKFIDMAGQENVDRRIQKILGHHLSNDTEPHEC